MSNTFKKLITTYFLNNDRHIAILFKLLNKECNLIIKIKPMIYAILFLLASLIWVRKVMTYPRNKTASKAFNLIDPHL